MKLFHVFDKPAVIKSGEDKAKGNIFNQMKNVKGIFLDPYIVLENFEAKLIHVMEKGELKSNFMPFDAELCYAKANPQKNSPLAIVGYDFQESSKMLKIKFYPYTSLIKEVPDKRTTTISKKGKEAIYDLFHMNDNYTALALGTTKGQGEIRVLCGKNLSLQDPTKDIEISLDTQLLKHIFVPVCEAVDVQNLYYATQTGIYYVDAVEKNKKGFQISHLSPQYCDINKAGEIVFINYENNTVHRINPTNREKDKEIMAEGAKKGLYLYNDYAVVISVAQTGNTTAVNMHIYDVTNEYIAFNLTCSQIRSIIPAINSIYCVMDTNVEKDCDLFVITEFENSVKLEKFFRRKFFDLAYKFAKSNNYDESLLAEISRHHGDHSHTKQDFDSAIKQYIQTIGYLEPSYVIRKFLEVAQIEYLISYLEELHNHPNKLANQHHTALLLNCFVKQKSIEKLKEWMTRVSTSSNRNNDYTETAVKVCMDLDQIALAKDFAQKCRHHELYLRILIENKADAKGTEDEVEKAKEADYLAAIQYIKNSVPSSERAKFVRLFGNALVKYHPDKIYELLIELVTSEFLSGQSSQPGVR